MENTILRTADFDPKLKLYWYLQTSWILLISFIGIPFLPIWLLGFGQWIAAKRLASMTATLSTRTLHFRKGHLFTVEKTIPLDKIQDVALHDGPILRALGLRSIKIETAGGSAQGGADMNLEGIIDAKAFRDAVLAQRDSVTLESSKAAKHEASEAPDAVLFEIRDILARIESKLDSKHEEASGDET